MSKDGGPAFPMAVDCSAGSRTEYQIGMSLRDYFAAKAMVALHCSDERGGTWTPESAAYCAKNAYIMADAMLAERNK